MVVVEDSLDKLAETYYTVLMHQGMLQPACSHNQLVALVDQTMDPKL
jgi:hypothetical protein